MLYAIEDGLAGLIIAAADDVVEYDVFYMNLPATPVPGLLAHEQVGVVARLSDPRYKGFTKPPYVLTFADPNARATFVTERGIGLCRPNELRDRQGHMIAKTKPDPYATRKEGDTGGLTIAEQFGLDKHDPWDKRSDEDKAAAEAMKKAMDELRKQGKLTGSSFGGPDKSKDKASKDEGASDEEKATVGVRRINITYGPDGRPHVSVLAEKIEEEVKTEDLPDDERLDVEQVGQVSMFHKVAVETVKLVDLEAMLTEASLWATAVARRNNSTGCWLAYPVQRMAIRAADLLNKAGHKAEFYVINTTGERLLPSGVELVEKDTTTKPRPWNEQAAVWHAQTADERETALKEMDGSEFYFCGYNKGIGCEMFIVPRAVFVKTKAVWDGESLPIAHLLPPDMVEVRPGLYACNSRSTTLISHDLYRKKFKDSMLMQMAVNAAMHQG